MTSSTSTPCIAGKAWGAAWVPLRSAGATFSARAAGLKLWPGPAPERETAYFDAQGVFPARQAFGLAHDAGRDVLVLTGGLVEPGSTQRHQDVWEWSGDPNARAVQVDAREPA